MARTTKSAKTPANPEAANESFETLFAALEERAQKLELGNLGLEDSLRLAEEAAEISQQLRTILDAAESRVVNIRSRFEEASAAPADAFAEEPVDYDYGDEEPL